MFRSSSEICARSNKRNRPAAGALLLLLAVLFAWAMAPAPVSADTGYTTDAFNVDITTDADHTFHVTEEIQVDFSAPRHGIYRDIPMGSRYYGIQNVRVYGYDYTTYEEGNALVVQIGSPDYVVSGIQNYRITYDIVGYRDDDPSKDMLALDLIPTGWATPIQSARVTMSLPAPAEGLRFYSGAYGETGENEYFTIRQDGTSLTALSKGVLPQGTGLTVRADLPEGYWVDPYTRDAELPWMYGVLGALGMLMLLLWAFVGRDDPIIPTVEFYPPEGMDPLETAYVANDSVAVKDLSALFMYFASKGYVRIVQTGEKKFRIVRLQDPDLAEQPHVRDVFYALFSDSKKKVDTDALPEELGVVAAKATGLVSRSFQGRKRSFSAVSKMGRAAGLLCCLLIPLLAAGFAFYVSFGAFSDLVTCLGTSVVIFAGMVSLVGKTDAWRTNKKPVRVIISFILVLAAILFEAFLIARYYPILALIFALSALAAMVATIFVRRRMNNELFGKVLGFREFIKTAEYDRLKMLSDEDPDYYFNILPYAYIFGMSTKWAEKFADFRIRQPQWYSSTVGGPFDPMFGNHMFIYSSHGLSGAVASHYKAVGESMLSSDSISSGGGGGGFGGGGFSGGGFGGGGGGAW